MKNYALLYVFIICTFSCAMDNTNFKLEDWLTESVVIVPHECSQTCVEFVHNMINATILGVDVNSWFSGIKSTYASVLQQSSDPEIALGELQKISFDIPEECQNESLFESLQLKNTHAAHLFSTLINHRLAQLKNVTGVTLDDILNREKTIPGLSVQMSNFIYSSAQKRYEQEMCLDKSMTEIPFDKTETEIHFTSLKSWYADIVSTLSLVNNGKHVQGITIFGKRIVWSVEDGQVDDNDEGCIAENQCFKNGYVHNKDYLATLGCGVKLPSLSSTIKTFKPVRRASLDQSVAVPTIKLSEILLFQRPTFASSLCKRALENSKNTQELEKLQNCSTIKTLQGFPASNLLEKIKNKIEHIKLLKNESL